MNKRLIFDAVRDLLGRGFTQDEVERLDRAIDRAASIATQRLGALSERFESGGRGAGAVSSGKGDPGGVSYGIWQLSSRAGSTSIRATRRFATRAGRSPSSTAARPASWRRQ